MKFPQQNTPTRKSGTDIVTGCPPARSCLWPALQLLLHAQVDTGAIVGTVQDSSGANIPDATVTVTEEATGRKEATQTGPDGSFILSPLKLGAYTLTAEKQGFKTTTQSHIQVTIQARLEINPKLEIGSISQNVQVTSSGPILDTQSSSLQQLVGERAIDKLPLNGRNAVFLAQLSPGVTIAQNDSRGLQASGSFTANGSRRTQNDYLLDGMDDNVQVADLVNQSQFVVLPPPDALREFTVQTNDYSAEFGHSAGAVLNLTTKSGSNAFHGDLWEFLRNDYFDAQGLFRFAYPAQAGVPAKPIRRNLRRSVGHSSSLQRPKQDVLLYGLPGNAHRAGQDLHRDRPHGSREQQRISPICRIWCRCRREPRPMPWAASFPAEPSSTPRPRAPLRQGSWIPSPASWPPASGQVRDPFYQGSVTGITNFTGPVDGSSAQSNSRWPSQPGGGRAVEALSFAAVERADQQLHHQPGGNDQYR